MHRKKMAPKFVKTTISPFLKFIFPLLLCTLYFACDKINDPFEKKEIKSTIDSTQNITDYTRYILLEEFTGHLCSNCPDAARHIQYLDSIHGTKLIAIAFHSGSFAVPHYPPDSTYLTDFRTSEGNTYTADFAVWGNPSGMVNRKKDANEERVFQKSDWENAISNFLNDSAIVGLSVSNFYSSGQRLLTSKIKIKWLTNDPGTYKLQAYLIEDHVIDWQLDGTYNNPNYDHRHVFRKALNGNWGEEIPAAIENDSTSFEYSITLSNSWNADNCEVVAFLYNSSTSSYEIIQAAEKKVNGQ